MPLISTRGASSSQAYGLIDQLIPAGPPEPGDLYHGGYLAGQIKVGANVYNIIMSPRAQGRLQLAQCTGSAMPAPTTRNDGWTNTTTYATTAYPLNKAARALVINGYSDWYIPSIEELALLYRTFKPTSTDNIVGVVNPSTVPVYPAYTATDPAQNTNPLFILNGAQSLQVAPEIVPMGSSTTYPGPLQYMLAMHSDDGRINGVSTVTDVVRTRVIRRELVTA